MHGALDGLRDVVRGFRPDVLLVQGDTATVFVGALVGYFEGVKVGHVEAGLRSHDKWAPFPEEIFRRLSDVLSDYYFAPTARRATRCWPRACRPERVHVTGNTVVDALRAAAGRDARYATRRWRAVLSGHGRLVLLTAHRRESFGEPLRRSFGAVRTLADRGPRHRGRLPGPPQPQRARTRRGSCCRTIPASTSRTRWTTSTW